jgi:hypothetical protein
MRVLLLLLLMLLVEVEVCQSVVYVAWDQNKANKGRTLSILVAIAAALLQD